MWKITSSLVLVGSLHLATSEALMQPEHNIQLACEIPSYSGELPVFSLGQQARFPTDIHQRILNSATPGIPLAIGSVADSHHYYDGNRLVSYFDDATGETAVFPTLGSLPGFIDENAGDVSEFLQNPDIIPKDDTQVSVAIGSRLRTSKKVKGEEASPSTTILLETIIQRNILYEGRLYPVYGPGSKASFRFGADGSVKAFSHLWRSAHSLGQTITSISTEMIWQNIVAQLVKVTAEATVHSIDLCFYDSGNDLIRPAYRYKASISDRYDIGYISAGDEKNEALFPSLAQRENQVVPRLVGSPKISKRQTGSASVGMYVAYGYPESDAMSGDVWGFCNDMTSASSGHVWVNHAQVKQPDPSFYNGGAFATMDGVAIVCSWGRGSAHNFTTSPLLSNQGSVNISSDLRPSGFGPGGGGMSGYWIIKANGTVQTPDVDPSVQERWYPAFNGLHAVLGYYGTPTFATSGNTGSLLGKGQSVVDAWTSDNAGSTVLIVCGHDNDTVYDLDDAGRADCLSVYWG